MNIPIRDRRVYWGAMLMGLALAGALGYHVVYGEHGYLTYRNEQRRYLELKQKTDKIKDDNDRLQKQIDALNRHDRTAIEKAARDQHLARPNERIYTYAPSDSQKAATDQQSVAPPASADTP